MRARNKWGFGPFSDTVRFDASFKPEAPSQSPVTTNAGAMIKIQWSLPVDNGATITAFEVLIREKDSDFSVNTLYCDGSNE